jgi:hypothetical protein
MSIWLLPNCIKVKIVSLLHILSTSFKKKKKRILSPPLPSLPLPPRENESEKRKNFSHSKPLFPLIFFHTLYKLPFGENRKESEK